MLTSLLQQWLKKGISTECKWYIYIEMNTLYFLCSFWRPLTPQLKQRCLRREKRWSALQQFWGKSQKPLTRCSTRQSHRSTRNTLKSMWWPSIPLRWHHKRLVVPIFFLLLLWRGLTWQYLGYFSMRRLVWGIWCLHNINFVEQKLK